MNASTPDARGSTGEVGAIGDIGAMGDIGASDIGDVNPEHFAGVALTEVGSCVYFQRTSAASSSVEKYPRNLPLAVAVHLLADFLYETPKNREDDPGFDSGY